jgi:microcin C transport system substrate-binding protein
VVKIEFLIDQKVFEMVVAPYLKNLQKLGIQASMRFVEENQYQTKINNFDFDIITAIFAQNIVPGSELYGYFHSSQKDVKGSQNLAGFGDKNLDKLVEKIAKTRSKNELKFLTKTLDKYLLENYYVITQWHNNQYRVLYRNIFAFPKITPKYSLSIDSWWIKNNHHQELIETNNKN